MLLSYLTLGFFYLILFFKNLILSSEYRRAFIRYIPIFKRFIKEMNIKRGKSQIKVKIIFIYSIYIIFVYISANSADDRLIFKYFIIQLDVYFVLL